MSQFKGIPILSAGEASPGEASARVVLAREASAGAALSGETSAGAVLSGEASAGAALSGETSAGAVLSGEASAGAMLAREASAGEALSGAALSGEVVSGEALAGAVPAREASAGEALSGAVLSREGSAGQALPGAALSGGALSGGALSGEGVSGKASRDGEPARSGDKYRTPQGFTAIKDGIKAAVKPAPAGTREIGARNPGARKPSWLRAPLASGVGFQAVKQIVRDHRLSTVCEEAKCPNIGECWNAGTATIMLMGAVCTRACRFCAVDTGNPQGWLDTEEPENVARSVELMGLQYVVLTSVDRDDLPDGGAAHYAAAIRAIKARTPQTAVEALTPDFAGVLADVYTVMDSGLDVFAQNVETVERLTHPVRDPRAGYRRTLDVLGAAKTYRPSVLTKTSLMLGLGETDAEIRGTMKDLRAAAVDLLTLGQYLRPTSNHLDVERFVSPEEFAEYRAWALDLGFLECVSGPLVRSSYRAEQALARNNAGLDLGLARRPVRAADSA